MSRNNARCPPGDVYQVQAVLGSQGLPEGRSQRWMASITADHPRGMDWWEAALW
jgi:hypothetical protein